MVVSQGLPVKSIIIFSLHISILHNIHVTATGNKVNFSELGVFIEISIIFKEGRSLSKDMNHNPVFE